MEREGPPIVTPLGQAQSAAAKIDEVLSRLPRLSDVPIQIQSNDYDLGSILKLVKTVVDEACGTEQYNAIVEKIKFQEIKAQDPEAFENLREFLFSLMKANQRDPVNYSRIHRLYDMAQHSSAN